MALLSFLSRAPRYATDAPKPPLLPGVRLCLYAFFVCAGATYYYDAPSVPPLWLFGGIAALCAVFYGAAKRTGKYQRIAVGAVLALCFCAGIGASVLELRIFRQDTLTHGLTATDITATVARVKQDGNKVKLYLKDIAYDDGFEILRPRWRARLSASVKLVPPEALMPGTVITIPRAAFRPLPLPVTPGGYDFAFFMYFERVGAIGFVTSYIKTETPATGGVFDRWRGIAAASILAGAPAPASSVAAALLTGERGAIPDENVEHMRRAGLAHLLAISGMHVGIVTGLCFLIFRRGLACIPPLANRYDIRRPAAVLALIAAGSYVLLTGAPVSAQRAFFMSGLFLIGLTVYRRAAALQSAGLAALCMALVMPHITLHPGFRMSFLAVIAIIAMFAHYERRKRLRGDVYIPHDGNIYARIRGIIVASFAYVLGAGLSSLAATMATTPFSVYHFHQFTMHGIWTNLAAIPLTALWVMPAGALSLLSMPFGWEHYPLQATAAGIDMLLKLAGYAAGHDTGVYVPTAPSGLALFFWLAAVMTGFLLHGKMRLIAIPCAIIAAALYLRTPIPDVFLHENGKIFAFRTDTTLVVNDRRGGGYARERWRETAGLKTETRFNAIPPSEELYCENKTNCVYRRNGGVIVISDTQEFLDRNAYNISVAVLLDHGLRTAAPTIITRDMLAEGGTHTIGFSQGKPPHIRVAREICPAGCPWRPAYVPAVDPMILKR